MREAVSKGRVFRPLKGKESQKPSWPLKDRYERFQEVLESARKEKGEVSKEERRNLEMRYLKPEEPRPFYHVPEPHKWYHPWHINLAFLNEEALNLVRRHFKCNKYKGLNVNRERMEKLMTFLRALDKGLLKYDSKERVLLFKSGKQTYQLAQLKPGDIGFYSEGLRPITVSTIVEGLPLFCKYFSTIEWEGERVLTQPNMELLFIYLEALELGTLKYDPTENALTVQVDGKSIFRFANPGVLSPP
jgi:hypothetical protein